MNLLVPVLALSALGLVFGLGLYFAHRKLGVHLDPKLEQILNRLPGANCGACGMAGCVALAEALIKGEAEVTRCAPAGPEAHSEIGRILGVAVEEKEKVKAVLHCCGGNPAKEKFRYQGIPDCRAANRFFGGSKGCSYGCLGLGTCAAVCPFEAIRMGEDGLPEIDLSRCTGCGRCVAECPKKLFSLVPEAKIVVSISCRSRDPGKEVIKVCPTGCIACRKCVRVCPVEAITMENNLAVIDYRKCTGCGRCVEECPRNTIKWLKDGRAADKQVDTAELIR